MIEIERRESFVLCKIDSKNRSKWTIQFYKVVKDKELQLVKREADEFFLGTIFLAFFVCCCCNLLKEYSISCYFEHSSHISWWLVQKHWKILNAIYSCRLEAWTNNEKLVVLHLLLLSKPRTKSSINIQYGKDMLYITSVDSRKEV